MVHLKGFVLQNTLTCFNMCKVESKRALKTESEMMCTADPVSISINTDLPLIVTGTVNGLV